MDSSNKLIEVKQALNNLSLKEREELMAEFNQSIVSQRRAYESLRDDTVNEIVGEALAFSEQMATMKAGFNSKLETFKQIAADYATTTGRTHKGNITLMHSSSLHKIEYAVQDNYSYDERSLEAETLLREWLITFINDENKLILDVVKGLLESKINGKLDHRQMSKLYKYENEIADVGFKKAIALLKESYQSVGSKSYIRIYERETPQSEWKQVSLSFANA